MRNALNFVFDDKVVNNMLSFLVAKTNVKVPLIYTIETKVNYGNELAMVYVEKKFHKVAMEQFLGT